MLVVVAMAACAPPREPQGPRATTTTSASSPLVPDVDDGNPGDAGGLSGTLAGMPFHARSALAGAAPDGSIWIDVFDAEVTCDRRPFARATRVSLSTDWPEGRAATANERFVVYDSHGSSVTRPFDDAKTTFGRRPTKTERGDLALVARSSEGGVEGRIFVRWCEPGAPDEEKSSD